MPALLRCSCPRCHRKAYDDAAEFNADHQGIELRHHEVQLVTPGWVTHQVFTGEMDNGQQVLVQVWPDERIAQVAFRSERREVWGPPIQMDAE